MSPSLSVYIRTIHNIAPFFKRRSTFSTRMGSSYNNFAEKDLGNPYELRIPVYARFWIYLIPNILSLLCSVFVLYHLLFNRTLRQALNNHIIIIIIIGLIYELTSVPLMLYWFQFSDTWRLTLSFAHFWTFIDYLCYSTQLVGFAWASIERHILIFHNHWVSTRKKRILIHYPPLLALMLYCFMYYFVFIVFPFCKEFILPSPFNSVPISCVLFDPTFYRYDSISHQFIPTFLIILLSLCLFLRVVWQKSRLNRSIEWRKQRKMTIQLLSISSIYLILMGPRTIFQFCIFIGFGTNDVMVLFYHSAFFANYITFLFPYVCCGAMPKLGGKLKKLFFCRTQRRVIVSVSSFATRTAQKRTGETGFPAH